MSFLERILLNKGDKNMRKNKKEISPNFGRDHFGVLLNALKKLNDPNLQYKQIASVKGVGLRKTTRLKHVKISDSEKIGGASYIIPLFNKLIDKMLENEG